MSESKSVVVRKKRYLESLANDPQFKEFVLDPLDKQIDFYKSVLLDCRSSEAQVRMAQGAFHLLTWVDESIQMANRNFASLQTRSKKESRDATRGTEPRKRPATRPSSAEQYLSRQG